MARILRITRLIRKALVRLAGDRNARRKVWKLSNFRLMRKALVRLAGDRNARRKVWKLLQFNVATGKFVFEEAGAALVDIEDCLLPVDKVDDDFILDRFLLLADQLITVWDVRNRPEPMSDSDSDDETGEPDDGLDDEDALW